MFENPDNERRINELEVELSELKDHVDELHGLLKIFAKSVTGETKTITNNIEDLMEALAHVSLGEKFECKSDGGHIILNHIP